MDSITELADLIFRDYNIDGSPSSGPFNPDKAAIRALFALIDQATGVGSGANHCISAIGADGTSYRSEPLVSPQMYTIRDVDGFLESASGGTWDIVLDRIPNPVPTTLTVVAAGKNQTNNLNPQVDGTWSLSPVVDDPFRFTLLESVYGPMEADGGIAYVPDTLIDASPELQLLTNWAREHGGALINMPPLGGLYLQSGSFKVIENSFYKCNGAFTFKANYRDQTTNFNNSLTTGTGSGAAGHGNLSKSYISDLWVFDNRAGQVWPAGQHAANVGTSSHPEKIQQHIYMFRCHIRGAAGYGLSHDNNNAQIHVHKIGGSIKWTDGDTRDGKNPLMKNARMVFRDESHHWPALGGQGTNLQAVRGQNNPFRSTPGSSTVLVAWNRHNWYSGDRVMISAVNQGNGITVPTTPVVITVTTASAFTIPGVGAAINVTAWGGHAVEIRKCIAVDGITTTNGQKYIDIPRSTDAACSIGEKAIIAGAGTVNGIVVDGIWDVYEAVSGTVLRLARVDPETGALTGTDATSSGTGGGSNITFLCAHLSPGDRIIDTRAINSTVDNVDADGEFYNRAGQQQRGGMSAEPNAGGGDYLSVRNYRFRDRTAKWIAEKGGGGTALAIDGYGFVGDDIVINGPGCRAGIGLTANSRGAQIGKYRIDGPRSGIVLRGNQNSIGKGKIRNSVTYGVSVWGSSQPLRIKAVDDPFTPLAVGDTRVIVTAPDHTVSTTDVGTIVGISNTNPVEITTAAPHGLAAGYLIGIRGVNGMTEINGRAGRYTVTSPTTFTLPINATGFGTYVSAGVIHNRRVLLAGFINGSGMILTASNNGSYVAAYIDADHYYIDAAQELGGAASTANSTDPFGGENVYITYGIAAVISTGNKIDGVEFEHDDPSNTATCIGNGDETGILSGERGRAVDTIVTNCRNDGFATDIADYDTTGILGPNGTSSALYKNNVGMFNQGPITQRILSTGNFNGHAYATAYKATLWSGGGGGGSGRRGAAASSRSGGSGGTAGIPVTRLFAAAELTFPVAVTIGAGGSGGAAQTVDSSNGSSGLAGGDTTFGAYLRARGGTGGWLGGSTAINPLNGNNSTTPVQNAGLLYPGATVIAGTYVSSASGGHGQTNGFGGGPGANGGGITSSNGDAQPPPAAWATWADPASVTPTMAAAGANGADGVNSLLLDFAGTGGGGGGTGQAAAAGAGGAGGRGSGGGGGGASTNGFNSGAGGAGGAGQVSVTIYF